MIEIRPLMALEGKAKSFILVEDGKEILRLQTSRMMSPSALQALLAPKRVKKTRKT